MDRTIPTYDTPGVRPIILVDEPRNGFVRALPWLAACLVTLGIHGGLFWYLTHESVPDVPPVVEEPAAVMIDMSPEVQQAFSQNEQAVGRPMEEAADEPPPPEDLKPDPIPPVEDSPTEAVAPLPPKPPEKPKVDKPPPPKKQPVPKKKPLKKPSNKAAPQTAGGPKSDQHAERTTASSAGAASAESIADWRSQVSAALNRNKHYPSGADEFGTPTIRMAIARSGAVTGVSIVSSSGSPDLDSAAIETVQRSSPLPPPPDGTSSLTFRMNFHRR